MNSDDETASSRYAVSTPDPVRWSRPKQLLAVLEGVFLGTSTAVQPYDIYVKDKFTGQTVYSARAEGVGVTSAMRQFRHDLGTLTVAEFKREYGA